MPREKLRETLEELHEELSGAEKLDEESRRMLVTALTEIRDRLEGDEASKPHTLADDLRNAVREFELSHPTLAGVIGRTIDLLAQSGI